MNELLKSAAVAKQAAGDEDLALINRQSLRTLTADEVFVFRIAACDDQVDRDMERFTVRALETMAKLFVGKSVIMDHQWSAAKQTARIYAGAVEAKGDIHRLILRAYIPRLESTAPVIDAIETGILREVSVGVAVSEVRCSICGEDMSRCSHIKGRVYEDIQCVGVLEDVVDAYELSLVAVPAQRDAGVVKGRKQKEGTLPPSDRAEDDFDSQLRMAQALQAQEEYRYGGMNQ